MAIEPGRQFPAPKFKFSKVYGNPQITAHHPETGAQIGVMHWDPKRGTIGKIEVAEPFRRQGVGTGMWNEGHRVAGENDVAAPVHSTGRTPEGDAWARSVGGDLP